MKPTQIPPGGWSEVTFGKTFSWLTLSNRFLGGGFATDTTCLVTPFEHYLFSHGLIEFLILNSFLALYLGFFSLDNFFKELAIT